MLLEEKQDILDKYKMYRRINDRPGMREAQREAREFMRRYPKLMDGRSLDRSWDSAEAARENMFKGISFSKNLMDDVRQRFQGIDED